MVASPRKKNINKKIHIAKNIIFFLTGAVTVASALDHEHTAHYLLTLRATDGGQPPLSTEVPLNVSVEDVNDNPPKFTSDT